MTFSIDDKKIVDGIVQALFRPGMSGSPFNEAANRVIVENAPELERVIAGALKEILADESFRLDLNVALRESLRTGLRAKIQTSVSALPRPEARKLAEQMGLLGDHGVGQEVR